MAEAVISTARATAFKRMVILMIREPESLVVAKQPYQFLYLKI